MRTIIADRGFVDQKRYEQLTGLGFDFIVRFRQNILVADRSVTNVARADRSSSGSRSCLGEFFNQ
jgi:hypothetical protein